MESNTRIRKGFRDRFELIDIFITIFLVGLTIMIIIPVFNVLAISFSSLRESLENPLMIFPREPTIDNYYRLMQDPRIPVGFRTTGLLVLIGVPFNLFLTTSMAYGLSRIDYPGARFVFFSVLITMLFSGGIVPLYILMMELNLINTIWALIFAYGVNTFYFIIMRTYMISLPVSLIESAKIDGAGEWRILLQIILPLSKPIIATILLFYTVDRWNEWFTGMVFLRRNDMIPLQLVLRNIVMDTEIINSLGIAGPEVPRFTAGVQAATIMLTMLPVMCVYPFLQRHFAKGIMLGAIKA